jgi:hypothetical protein
VIEHKLQPPRSSRSEKLCLPLRDLEFLAPASEESWFALGETQHAGAERGMLN